MGTNILFITADDMEGTTPGAFGGLGDVTPALDSLAAEGMIFDRAHVAVAVCQPSRSAIMTGLWPHRNGAEGFEPIREGVPLLTERLASVGYLTGILGKVNHLQPVERFAWDTVVEMRDLGLGRDPARYAAETAAFLERAGDQPWFLMVNAHDPHRPFYGADDVRRAFGDAADAIPEPSKTFGPEDDAAMPPAYLPDIPEVRTEYAQYLSSARRCDDVVGAVLTALEASGPSDTLVVFLSDNGMAFPFSKANCYLQSTRTPLIVRWPGVVEAGRRESERFTTMLDLFPTFCEVSGADAGDIDGESLVPVLRGSPSSAARDHVVTVFHETAGKGRYEMRCVQDARYGYIWNGWSDGETEYRAENMMGLTWPAMLAAAEHDDTIAARVEFYVSRRGEELYDLEADPAGLRDLSADASSSAALAASREALRAWMVETADPLLGRFDDDLDTRMPTPGGKA